MQDASAIVQKAVFATLEADNLLLGGLGGEPRDTSVLPQLSFDGMTSRWRDRPLGLVGHRVQFSNWGHLAGFADMQSLSQRLVRRLEQVEVAPLHLVRARLLEMESRLNTTNRLWRQQVSFEIVTQNLSETG